MIGELHRVFLTQLEFLEFPLRAIDPTDHSLRKKNSDRHQSSRDRDDHEKQGGPDPACGLTQGGREPVLPRPQFLVDLDNAVQYESESGWVYATGQVERMELFGGRVKPREEVISGPPYIEHALHVTHAVKALIQADDAGDVIRMGSTFQEASPHGGIVRSRFFKLEPGLLETKGHRDRLPIAAEIGIGFRFSETQQVEHRFLLILRPQALAFDVGPTRGEDVYADNGKPDQHSDDRQEWRNDQEHAFAHCKPLSDFCERSHKGFDVNVCHGCLSVLPFVLPEPLRYRKKLALASVSEPNRSEPKRARCMPARGANGTSANPWKLPLGAESSFYSALTGDDFSPGTAEFQQLAMVEVRDFAK